MGQPTFNQLTHRIRDDDGNETTATWLAAQGADYEWDVVAKTNIRVRFLVDEQNVKAWSSLTFNVYYSLNSAAYAAVGAGTPIQYATSSNYSNGDDCTSQLTGGSGSFLSNNNGMMSGANAATNTGAINNYFEVEICLKVDAAQVSNTDTIDLRVYESTNALNSYVDTPRLTVAGLPGNVVSTAAWFGGMQSSWGGPFVDGNGNLYLILNDRTNKNQIKAWKSTNGGSTWAEQDSTNRPVQGGTNNTASFDVFQDGTTLHIVSYAATSPTLYYNTFRTSDDGSNPDTWGTTDSSITTYSDTGAEYGVTILVQSDGDIFVSSNGDDSTYFLTYECVEYHYNQGSGWTTKQELLGTESDNICQASVLGESNKIHTFNKEDTNGRWVHRSLADVTSSPSAIDSASNTVTAPGENYNQARKAIYIDAAGTEKILFGYLASDYSPYTTTVTDDAVPANGVQVTTQTVWRSTGAYASSVHCAAANLCKFGTDVYYVFSDNSTKDIFYSKSTNYGSTWGTPVEVFDGIDADYLSANIYVRSGAIYLGIAWLDGTYDSPGDVLFDEYFLGYVIQPNTGSYTITGQNPSLLYGRKITLDAGSYTVTGQNPDLLYGRKIALDTGSYSITGQDPTLTYTPGTGYTINLDLGTYSVTGQNPSLLVGRKVLPDVGSYSVTGLDLSLLVSRLLEPVLGTYSITGQDPELIRRTLDLNLGTYSITGQDPSLIVDRKIILDAGSYSITGQDATLSFGFSLPLDLGTYSVTGQDPDLLVSRIIDFNLGSYSITGQDLNLVIYRLACELGTYSVTGQDPSLLISRVIDPELGTYSITGQDPGLLRGYPLPLDLGVYSITGLDPDLLFGHIIDTEVGSYTISGLSSSLLIGRNIPLELGTYSITGRDPSLLVSRLLAFNLGTYTISGLDATLTYTPIGGYTITLDLGTYSITGLAVSLLADRKLVPDLGIYTITGQTLSLLVDRKLDLETGTYSITGQDLELVYRVLALELGTYSVTGLDPDLLVARQLSTDLGSYTVSGLDPALLVSYQLGLEVGSYSLTGQTLSLLVDRQLVFNLGTYNINGLDVTLTYTPTTGYTISLDIGSYAISGQDPSLLVSRLLNFDNGVYSITGQDPQILRGYPFSLETGVYTITGNSATILASFLMGAEAGSYLITGLANTFLYSAVVVPDSRINSINKEDRVLVVNDDERNIAVIKEDRTFSVNSK